MRLSKLCLGTAQLGMDYGINNLTGKPDPDESRAIIQTAVEEGINTFDTASVYGDSETILGQSLGDLDQECILVSKLPPVDWTQPPAEIGRRIEISLEETLRHLGISRLSIYLFHRFEDLWPQNGLAVKKLESLKAQGLIEKWGVSTYTPCQAEECLDVENIGVIQVPCNLADQRLLKNDFFKRAQEKAKTIFVRSVFLQGLFFKKNLSWPLEDFEPYRQELEKIARNEGLAMTELALRYVLSIDGIDSILIGVETLGQLKEDIRIFREGGLPKSLLDRVLQLGPVPEKIIDPRQWTAAS
jgi:aryl-alcohol dehydrogenase-like predicted oxidoreductase